MRIVCCAGNWNKEMGKGSERYVRPDHGKVMTVSLSLLMVIFFIVLAPV